MHYRPEIDGLRAIAVISIIFFHAGFSLFGGGFVGVDIFFVISGYLLTTIILSELENGRFSIIGFWERRARRILPALFVVLMVCLPFAWVWLLPSDMKSFSESLASISVFSSNFLFWRTSGYFAASTELKPLIHSWSLSVEEQYYLLFPIFLVLTWRFGKLWTLALMAIAAACSLALAEWTSTVMPAAAFYLLPTRCWEFFVGAFVALHFVDKNRALFSGFVSEVGSLAGLALITYAVFAFDKATPFPGFYALAPTIGTALIILFASQKTIVGKVLSTKIFVAIGLLSYSAYLWHQPLFAFARHRNLNDPDKLLLSALAVASIGFGYLSWKYIENPFRDRQKITRKRILQFGVIGSTVFAILGMTGHFTNGFEKRFSKEQTAFLSHFENSKPERKYFRHINLQEEFRYQCNFYDIERLLSGNPSAIPVARIADECFVRRSNLKNSLFIWGDSHAQQLYSGLKSEMPESWQILQVASSNCAAALNARENRRNYCEYSNWFAFKTIRELVPDVVLIGQNLKHDVSKMSDIGQMLSSIGVKKVIFTGPTPHWNWDLPKVVAFRFFEETPRKILVGVNKKVASQDKALKRDFEETETQKYVSIIDYFCTPKGCDVFYGDSVQNGITSWDYGHLTPIASRRLAKDILSKKIAGDRD